MNNKGILFKEHILELLDLSTSPEKALQLLSSPSFLPSVYSTNDYDYEPVVIYIVCIRYMASRVPEACVKGIWEDFIRKIVKYSHNFSEMSDELLQQFIHDGCFSHVPKLCRKFVPIKDGPLVCSWLDEVLSTPANCSNPYIRLELFCMMRSRFIFRHSIMPMKKLSVTFIHTICEIEPHHLYPSVDEYDVRIRFRDIFKIINQLRLYGELQKIISRDLFEQFNEGNEAIVNCSNTKFICHFMKMIGTFAVISGSNSDYKNQAEETKCCLTLFKKGIGNLVNCDNHLPSNSPWQQFLHIINLPPFRHYTTEVIGDLTVAIIKNRSDLMELLMSFRDLIMRDLDICSRSCELPRLLLSRQINGPAPVRRHSLLLKRLSKDQDNLRNNDDIDKKWKEISNILLREHRIV